MRVQSTKEARKQPTGPVRQPTGPLAQEELARLAIRVKAGDKAARETIILANLGLVRQIAGRYRSSGASADDLIQEGCYGLIEAVERYDPQTHTAKFSTYAVYWIRNRIRHAVAANYSLIRLPSYVFRSRVRSFRSGGTGLPVTKVVSPSSAWTDEHGNALRLEDELIDSYQPELREPDEEASPEIDLLLQAINRLTPLEAWVIRRRFGLDDPAGGRARKKFATDRRPVNGIWTISEISIGLGLSRHRTRMVERSAMAKLRGMLARPQEGEEPQ